jgi:HD-GYP domain-containing protein (c-di-GMP phosphodiesterase class II)
MIQTKKNQQASKSKQSQDEVEATLLAQLRDLGDGITETGPVDTILEEKLHSETAKAVKIIDETLTLAEDIFAKFKKNQEIKIDPIVKVTRDMLSSFSRDQEALTSLAMLKNKDNHSFTHSVNVSIYLIALAKQMNFSEKDQAWLGIGGLLQDIGLAKVPKDILLKKGKLAANERKFMQLHVDFGMHSIKNMPNVSPLVKNILTQHHERLDGTGYPNQLKGFKISKEGKMAAIVDSFDAITSQRSYRNQQENHVAFKAIMQLCKDKYDKGVFQHFIKSVGVFPVGSTIKLANGTVCVVLRNHIVDLLHPIVRPVLSKSGAKLEREAPLDLMLSKDDKTLSIVDHVSPKTIDIDPLDFLPNAAAYKRT